MTKSPGALLTPVRLAGAAGDFSARVSFQCRLSYGARIPPRVVVRISICGRILAAVPLIAHTKMLLTLADMGSAAPAAAIE